MSIKLPDNRNALHTVLLERATGVEHVLFEREGRFCHFAVEYPHKEHIVCLRVDWRDLEDGDPTLDADIYENVEGAKGRKLPNREWHHTRLTATAPGEVRAYAFRFRDLALDLVARKTLSVSASVSAYIVDPDEQPLRGSIPES